MPPGIMDSPPKSGNSDPVTVSKEEYNMLKKAYEEQSTRKREFDHLKDELRKAQEKNKQLENNQVEMREILTRQQEENKIEMERQMQEQFNDLVKQMKEKEDTSKDNKIENKARKTDKKNNLTPRESSRKDVDPELSKFEDNSDEGWKTVDSKKKNKKKTDKQIGIKKTSNINVTLDSMYDISDEMTSDSTDEDCLDRKQHGDREIRFFSHVPEVEPFGNKRGQDILKFFSEYEKYCQQCYAGRKNLWIKGLKDSLEGPILEAFKAMTSDTGLNVKYDIIKNRIIDQAQLMKKASKQDKRSNFDRIKMHSGESLWAYALRLEIAAIEKFDEEYLDVEDDKELFRKFLDTIPDEKRVQIIKQREQRRRMGVKRYSWNDLRRDLEEDTFEMSASDSPRHEKTVRMAVQDDDNTVFDSYKDALLSSQKSKEVDWLYMVKATWEESKKQTELLERLTRPRGRDSSRGSENRRFDRSSSGNRSYSGNRSTGERSLSQSRQDSQREENEFCTYCKRTGHNWRICRTRRGECYACGKNGHLIANCPKKSEKKEERKETRQDSGHAQQNKMKCQLCDGAGHEVKTCPSFVKLQKEQATGN